VALDHVAFGTRDAAEAREALTALGFATSPPATCEWTLAGITHSAPAVSGVFPYQYLDVIEIPGAGWKGHLDGSKVYGRGLAPTGIVLRGVPPATAAGEVGSAPYTIVRHVSARPPVDIAYTFLSLARLELPIGLVEESDADSIRRASPRSHPNTVDGIARVHLRVPSLDSALERLAGEPLRLPPSEVIPLDGPELLLHESTPEGYLEEVSQLLPDTGRPNLLALEYAVASVRLAAEHLRSHGVEFRSSGDSIFVDPAQGFGTGVIFAQSSA